MIRKKRNLILLSLLFIYLIYGLYISRIKLSLTDPVLNTKINSKYYDYKGVSHLHSNFGVGSRDIDYISKQAKDAGLDYIIFTDENPYKEPKTYEGYQDNLIILQGGKYSYLDSRILYYPNDAYKLLFSNLAKAQTFFTDMLSQDKKESFIVLTDPSSKNNTWLDRSLNALSGIEVINLRRLWKDSWKDNKWRFLASLLIYPFHSDYAMIRLYKPPNEDLEKWDALQQNHKVTGFLGNDISAKSNLFGSDYTIEFPSYFVSFKLASNHILIPSELTGIYHKDKQKILNALKSGHFYMSFDVLGDPSGFFAEIKDQHQVHPMGSKIKFSPNLHLNVHLPENLKGKYSIQIVKDGKIISETNQLLSSTKIHMPGVYRVQVKVRSVLPFPDHRQWLDWIYTNSFYIYK